MALTYWIDVSEVFFCSFMRQIRKVYFYGGYLPQTIGNFNILSLYFLMSLSN